MTHLGCYRPRSLGVPWHSSPLRSLVRSLVSRVASRIFLLTKIFTFVFPGSLYFQRLFLLFRNPSNWRRSFFPAPQAPSFPDLNYLRAEAQHMISLLVAVSGSCVSYLEDWRRDTLFSPGVIKVYKQLLLAAASKKQVSPWGFRSAAWDTHPQTRMHPVTCCLMAFTTQSIFSPMTVTLPHIRQHHLETEKKKCRCWKATLRWGILGLPHSLVKLCDISKWDPDALPFPQESPLEDTILTHHWSEWRKDQGLRQQNALHHTPKDNLLCYLYLQMHNVIGKKKKKATI